MMQLYIKVIYSVFLFFFLFIFVSCSEEPTESKTGKVSVSVVDNDMDATPVPDAEITVTPGGIVKKTDANGLCSFELNPGDYFIDAELCCIGPGNIQYHEPVVVVQNETVEVKLIACLQCR